MQASWQKKGLQMQDGNPPSLSVVGAPKRLNLFRFVKCSSCHLRRSPEVHLGSSRGRHTKSCCAQKLQHS